MTGELTPGQRLLLDRLSASELAETFYFTGGSALAAYYLHHRRSMDLDFFARHPFDPKRVVRVLNDVADGDLIPRRVQDRYEFTIEVQGERLRVEFVHYDYDSIADSGEHFGRIRVDSLRDILANKLSAIIERTEGKDFADLYFLLRRPELSLEQGILDCQAKFGWPGLRILLQRAFLKAERLEAWPRTQPPTTPEEARTFFREQARTLIDLDDS
jgi:predicted nucleotidyltransferase component of viral defense system